MLWLAAGLAACTASAAAEPTEPENSPEESEMWKLVNADRAKFGFKPLELDRRLSALARRHSMDMVENHFFAHESPTTGEPKDRFFKAAIAAEKFAENIAHNSTIKMAEVGLMNSPGHRKNLLDPDFTHIGIGIVNGADGHFYVTQNFMKPMPVVDLSKAPEQFLEKVNVMRQEKGLEPLQSDPALQAVCQANCRSMNRNGKLGLETAQAELKKKSGYRNLRVHYQFIRSLDSLQSVSDLASPEVSRIGIGVVRNEKKETGYGMLWVTLILASPKGK
ncbi:MAG: hypothetical protein HYU36_13485 [Planctomycetes bacterium]|nr:hypothetical protein [Planctomycetota bacterium]